MIRIRFELTPLHQVTPWGDPQEQVLHWFGLTDGCYWIELDGVVLLRYAPQAAAARQPGDSWGRAHSYADYYVARFWEDIIALAPSAAEPVPASLASFIASDPSTWHQDVQDSAWMDDDAQVAAATWHEGHSLDFGYLKSAPIIWCWRTVHGDRDVMTVVWRHCRVIDGIRWTAGRYAQAVVATAEFDAAVRQFDRDFMDAMTARVRELEGAGPPGVADLDLDALKAEHLDRMTWLGQRLLRPRARTDWPAIHAGAAALLSSGRRLP